MGVDVNANGENDFIEVFLTGFTADLSLDLFTVDLLSGTGTPGISLSAESLNFSGYVGDVSTDPPFSFELIAPLDVPAPAPLALMMLGLGMLVRLRR